MAKALNLDKTYLSQLENGRRPVQDWVLEKAREIEKSTLVKAQQAREAAASYSKDSIHERCHQYLSQVLDACSGDEDRLRWTFVELKRHFPISSKPRSAAGELLDAAAGEPDPSQ